MVHNRVYVKVLHARDAYDARRRGVVAMHAEGAWLTVKQAEQAAHRILRAARRLKQLQLKANKLKRKKKPR